MTKRFLLIVCSLLVMLICNAVHAQSVDGHLNDMFSALGAKVNVTEPEAYTTARRGVISGGQFQMRSRIIRPNIISFDPPSFKAGCGGISIYGGALSFINAQQFQDTMRAIAANSVGLLSGYAFTMALDAMCEKCGQKINELARKIQEIASKLKNSCEAAKALTASAHSTMKEWAESKRQDAGVASANSGIASDFLSGLTSAADGILKGLPSSEKAKFTGNVVWAAFVETSYASWFTAGTNGNKALEMLMSLTGSFVVRQSPDGKDLKFDPIPPLIDLDQYLDGGQVNIWSCGTDTGECLQPIQVSVNIKGFKARVYEMLMGSTGSGGIVEKFRATSSSGAFSNAEKAFIAAMPPGAAALLSNYANRKSAATVLENTAVELISATMVEIYIRQALDSMEYSIAAKPNDGSTAVTDRIKMLRQRLPEFSKRAIDLHQLLNENLRQIDDARNQIRKPSN